MATITRTSIKIVSKIYRQLEEPRMCSSGYQAILSRLTMRSGNEATSAVCSGIHLSVAQAMSWSLTQLLKHSLSPRQL